MSSIASVILALGRICFTIMACANTVGVTFQKPALAIEVPLFIYKPVSRSY